MRPRTAAEALNVRDAELSDLAERARAALVGRRIVGVDALPHIVSCDSPNVLRLAFSDGGEVEIVGGYGGYTGHSCDEYVETVDVRPLADPP